MDMAWLRKQMRDHIANSDSIDEPEKILRFPNVSACSIGKDDEAATDNVYQAAEVIWRMVERAAAVEARLRSLADGAVEKLQLANDRVQSLETERQVAEARIQEAEAHIRVAEDTLKLAELRIADAERQRSQADLRAKNAETQASEVQEVFTRIERMEDEIRTRLLGQERGVSRYQRRQHIQPAGRTNFRPLSARRETSREVRFSITS
jgi:chromosome segregation ATPase